VDTRDPTPPPPLLHLHFRRAARDRPDAVALVEGEVRTSFAEIGRRTSAVARGLRERSVGRGDVVGLRARRSGDQVAGLLGILEVGAAVVPLPPSDPQGRLRDVLAASDLDLLLDDGTAPLPSAGLPPAASLATLTRGSGAREPGIVHEGPGKPDDPAFILSTSGSTGRPKMIVRSHRSFFHRLGWTWERHPFGPGEVGCQKAHSTTTHALYELFEPLLRGVPVAIIPDEEARNLEAFWGRVREHGVTRLLLVPSALRASLHMSDFRPPPLSVLVLMGEYVDPELAVRAVNTFPGTTALYSIYGSTEASSTLVVDLRASAAPGEELPLGVPLTPDVRPRVLDDDLREVPPGTAGRLWMGGTPLFHGYWNDPERTDRVRVEIPGREEPLYDTRDQVLRTAQGELHFLGRVDDVVKIRGFRVDLQEVERHLLLHPDIRHAVVVVDASGDGADALAAFYTPDAVDPSEVRAHLAGRLPDYMVPSRLVAREAFPRTASAKIDRRALAASLTPEGTRPAARAGRALTPTETAVATAWARVLGHGEFGLTDSFFEVGGTSLTAFAAVQGIRDLLELGREDLPAEALYRWPGVEALAARLDGSGPEAQAMSTGPTSILVPLRSGPADSPAQPPLFAVASAGGTVGAYERLSRQLEGDRPVVGITDPFLRGGRALTEGFDAWVGRYVEAVVERQPRGPYHLLAYSSAGALGYEMARRLRASGRDVALLALVDPLALDRGSRWRFGYWALRATWARPSVRTAIRVLGRLRGPLVRVIGTLDRDGRGAGPGFTPEGVRAVTREARESGPHLKRLSGLLELNTGLPLALSDDDLEGVPPEDRLHVLLARMGEVAPEVDPEMIERLAVQYEIQVRLHHAYRLRRYAGRVLLVEPESPHAGLLAAQLRPWVGRLTARVLPLGPASPGVRALAPRFGGLEAHYRSMRDERFVSGLARELEAALGSRRAEAPGRGPSDPR
jgi:amino acid adenylation domain-containing protein